MRFYGIKFFNLGSWNLHELELLWQAIQDMLSAAHWDIADFRHAMGADVAGQEIVLVRHHVVYNRDGPQGNYESASYDAHGTPRYLVIGDKSSHFGDKNFKWNVVKELALMWNYASGGALARGFVPAVGARGTVGDYNPGAEGYPTENARRRADYREDWADSVAAYVYPGAPDTWTGKPIKALGSRRSAYVGARMLDAHNWGVQHPTLP